jgi:hypothetical protein
MVCGLLTLLAAGSSQAADVSLTASDPSGAGLEWDTTTLATDGTIRVKATELAKLTIAISGAGTERAITISWDAIYGNHILQSQTNAVGVGIRTDPADWVDFINAPNPLFIQPIPAGENVFFRLFRP